LRSLLMRNSGDLPYVVAELNEAVHHSSSDDRYSTLFCGVVSPDRSEMRYVNAGHIPPFIMHADGTVGRPPGTNLPVGMLAGVSYKERKAAIAPGDLIVCVSDGIVEAQNAQREFWDEQGAERVLHEHREAPVEQVTDALVRAADDWAGGAEQHDDMTVVVIRIAG
jgi:sigma-B regulation protein RsbU (phosphoserine phosphatase)